MGDFRRGGAVGLPFSAGPRGVRAAPVVVATPWADGGLKIGECARPGACVFVGEGCGRVRRPSCGHSAASGQVGEGGAVDVLQHDGAVVLDEVAREVKCSFVVVAGPQGDAGRLQGQSLREAEEQGHALLLGGAFDGQEAAFVQQDGVAQSHRGGDLSEVEVDAVVGVAVEALDEGAAAVAEPLDDTFGPFEAEGGTWRWYTEIIRDVDETDQEYTWTAFVCGKESVPRLWAPAYAARSERLQRVSRAAGSYAARMRGLGLEATVERLDPLAVYERDGWICQICKTAVERERAWPDMWCATLDHRIPLTAGGEHTLLNVQLAHWICNLHKGDYFPVDFVVPSAGRQSAGHGQGGRPARMAATGADRLPAPFAEGRTVRQSVPGLSCSPSSRGRRGGRADAQSAHLPPPVPEAATPTTPHHLLHCVQG